MMLWPTCLNRLRQYYSDNIVFWVWNMIQDIFHAKYYNGTFHEERLSKKTSVQIIFLYNDQGFYYHSVSHQFHIITENVIVQSLFSNVSSLLGKFSPQCWSRRSVQHGLCFLLYRFV